MLTPRLLNFRSFSNPLIIGTPPFIWHLRVYDIRLTAIGEKLSVVRPQFIPYIDPLPYG